VAEPDDDSAGSPKPVEPKIVAAPSGDTPAVIPLPRNGDSALVVITPPPGLWDKLLKLVDKVMGTQTKLLAGRLNAFGTVGFTVVSVILAVIRVLTGWLIAVVASLFVVELVFCVLAIYFMDKSTNKIPNP
jgi:hypothetical protein